MSIDAGISKVPRAAADTYAPTTLELPTGASLPSAPEHPPGQLQALLLPPGTQPPALEQPNSADPSSLLQLLRPPSQPETPRPSRFAADTLLNPGVEVEVMKQAPGPFPLLPQPP